MKKILILLVCTCALGVQAMPPPPPHAQTVDCGPAPVPRYGRTRTPDGTTLNRVAQYSCDKQFELVGSESSTCTADGTWRPEPPICRSVFCPRLSSPTNGIVRAPSTSVGAEATYECFRGYFLEGSPIRVCAENRQWTGIMPRCILVKCEDLEDPENGQVSVSGFTFGSRARYRCYPGSSLEGDTTRVCEDNGFWSGQPPVCIFDGCPQLEAPLNGYVQMTGTSVGSVATFTCDPGFELVAKFENRICQSDGRWSGIPPECRPVPSGVTCPALSNPENGRVIVSSYTVGSVANYICFNDYFLVGNPSRVCGPDATWSGKDPTCSPTPTTPPPPSRVIISFTQETFRVVEGQPQVTVRVILVRGSPRRNTQITLRTSDLSAVDSLDTFNCFDYIFTSETVTFDAGAPTGSQAIVTIPINDDNCVEQPESFQVTLTSGDPDVDFERGSSTVLITDNDFPEYGFTQISYSVDEADTTVQPAIELTNNVVLTFQTTVSVEDIPGGSATDGTDYFGVDASLTFVPGSRVGTTVPFDVQIFADDIDEPDEIIILFATTTTPGRVTQSNSRVVIIDRAPQPQVQFTFTRTTYDVTEGVREVPVVVQLISGRLDELTTITVTPSDITATDTVDRFGCFDYESTFRTVTFNAGTTPGSPGSQMTVGIPINDDNCVERDERFRVTLTSIDENVNFPNPTATITITDNDRPQYRFTEQVYIVDESTTSAQPALILVSDTVLTFTTVVRVVDTPEGNATDSSDYIGVDTRVIFPPGTRPNELQTFTIPILDDLLVEGNEFIRLQARTDNPDEVQDEADVYILDNDVCEVGLEFGGYVVREGNVQQEVCIVKRNAAELTEDAQVSVSTSDGTAQAGSDYTAVRTTVTFGPRRSSRQCVQVPILDDDEDEPDEDFTIIITFIPDPRDSRDPIEITPGGRTTTVRITDNDDMPEFSFTETDYNVNEEERTVEICVDLIRGRIGSESVTINLSPQSGSASSGDDFDSSDRSVTFDPRSGPGSRECAEFPITDDNLVERPESFRVVAEPDGDIGFPTGRSTTVNIIDDDVPVFEFTEITYTVTENGRQVEPVIRLTNNVELTYPIRIQVEDVPGGTATVRSDYNPVKVDITFRPGDDRDTERRVIVRINDDQTPENDETIIIEANPDDPAQFPDDRTTVVIEDDDTVGVNIAFTQRTYNVEEGDGYVPVIIEIIDGVPDEPFLITITTEDDSATDNVDAFGCSDYQGMSRMFGFPSDTTQAVVEILINDDNCVEREESFTVTITSTNQNIMFPRGGTSTVTIEDNDTPEFRFSQSTYSVNEGDDARPAIELFSNTVLTFPILVGVNDEDGTATRGLDYPRGSARILFLPGSQRGTDESFSIPIIDDDLVEGDEVIMLRVETDGRGNVPQTSPGRPTARILITDNDVCLVGLEFGTYTFMEDNSRQEVCIVKRNTAELTEDARVRVSTSDGTAEAGSDYNAVQTIVTFGPRRPPRQCVQVPILEDDEDEPDEDFTITITFIPDPESPDDDPISIPPEDSTSTVTITDDDVPRFAFSQPDYSVTEGEGDDNVEICVDLIEGTLQRSVRISLQPQSGTASSGDDFSSVTRSVTFPARSSPGSPTAQQCAEFPITDDNLVERPENFRVVAEPDDSMALFPRGRSSNVEIGDNDVPQFRFTQDEYVVNENDRLARPVIELFSNTELTFPIQVTVEDTGRGTADEGEDYTIVQSSVLFQTGSGRNDQVEVDIPIIDDLEPEEDETILLRISTDSPGEVPSEEGGGQPTSEVIIRDNDPRDVDFVLTETTYNVNEGDKFVTVVIELTQGTPDEPIPVTLTTRDQTASDDEDRFGCFDYESTSETVTFAVGAARGSQMTVQIRINDDNCVERDERFRVMISSTNENARFPEGRTSTVLIKDNDIPEYEFTSRTFTVNEDESPARPAVRLSSDTVLTFQTTVNVMTIRGGSADDGDFSGIDIDVPFPVGSDRDTEVTLRIPIINDQFVEPNEDIRLQGSTPDFGNFPDPQAEVIIVDDDVCVVGFEFSSFVVGEGNVQQEVCVQKVNAAELTEDVEVEVSTEDGSADAGSDYTALPSGTTVTFGPRRLPRQCVQIPILDDNEDEPDEDFTVTITFDPPFDPNRPNPPISIIPGGQTTTITITDDDEPRFSFTERDVIVEEGDGVVEICVQLDEGITRERITINLRTQDGSARGGDDFSSVTRLVAFPARTSPGSPNAEQCAEFPITDDNLVERPENFRVVAVPGDDILFPDGRSTVTIRDNDIPIFRFTENRYTVTEGEDVEVVIELFSNNELTFPITIRVTDNDRGSATEGDDYSDVDTTVTFRPGSRQNDQQTVIVLIFDDNDKEEKENFFVIGTPDEPAQFPDPETEVVIEDNEPRDVDFVFTETTYNVNEGDQFVTVVIELTQGTPDEPIPVTLTTRDQTASDDEDRFGCFDYESTSETVTFPAGAARGSQMTVQIRINDDNCVERDERFRVMISSTNENARFPEGRVSTVLIKDNDIPQYRFTEDSYIVDEDDRRAVPFIELFSNTVLTFPSTVIIEVRDGSAEEPDDYNVPGTGRTVEVLFVAGSDRGTEVAPRAPIPIIDDFLVEEDEDILLRATVESGDPGEVPSDGRPNSRIVIRDNDVCIVGLEFGTYTVREGNVQQEVCIVKRNAAELTEDAQVSVSTTDGSARAGSDYTALPSTTTVTFGPRRSSRQCVQVPILEDDVDEPDESFTITISTLVSTLEIPTSEQTSTVTITDNDMLRVSFGQPDYNVNEGDGFVEVCIRLLEGIPLSDVRITLSTQDSSASSGLDFSDGPTNVVTFRAGSTPGSEACEEFPILEDELVERPENFRVIARPDDSAIVFTGGSSRTVTIEDNDRPLFRFTRTTYNVNEPDGSATVGIELVEKTLTFPIDLRAINTPDGTASVTSDFIRVFTEVEFPTNSRPGDTETFDVIIIDDEEVEERESIILIVSSEEPGRVDPNTATVFIEDDDEPEVEFTFTQRTYNVNEGDRTVPVIIELIGGSSNEPVSFTLSTNDQSATASEDRFGCFDYVSRSITVTFDANVGVGSQVTVNIPINDDNCVEREESFTVTISSDDPNIMFPRGSSATVTITDNDFPQYRFTQSSYTVDEEERQVTPVIELFSDTVLTFLSVVNIQDTQQGSATDGGVDYNDVVGVSVRFLAGSSNGSQEPFNVRIVDDVLVEEVETIVLRASTDAPGQIPESGQPTTQIIIRDNDVVDCGDLPNPSNGIVTFTTTTVDSTATYTCNDGFELTGVRVRTCEITGSWSGQEPTCVRIPTCELLSNPSNGRVVFLSVTVGSRATYTCNSGFRLEGDRSRVCQDNEQWSGSEPQCIRIPPTCEQLSNPSNGRVFFRSTAVGSTATYSCNNGFDLVGIRVRTCQLDGQWSGEAPTCIRTPNCERLSNPSNGQVSFRSTTVGSTATYTCNSGFRLEGDRSRVCQDNEKWSGSEPQCIRIPPNCQRLSNPSNGRVSFRSTIVGSMATYSCNNGFDLNGDRTRICQSNGQWSGQAPTCTRTPNCERLSNPSNGRVVFSSVTVGSTATYTCNSGFRLEGDRSRVCQDNEKWSGSEPQCIRIPPNCQQLSNPSNGRVSFRSTTVGSTATYSCNNGFDLNGDRTRICQSNGQWSGQAPTCTRTPTCERLSNPSNGRVSFRSTTVSSTATYTCNSGFRLEGVRSRVCQDNEKWSGSEPQCIRIPPNCQRLSNPSNGRVSFRSTIVGSTATYSCNNGFDLNGDRTRICQSNGQWSGQAPTCTRTPTCERLSNPSNGRVSFRSTTVGSTATYSCNSGFTLSGESVRTCQRDGQWSRQAPTCTRTPTCGRLSNPHNGQVVFSSTTVGSRAKYSCDRGFTLDGATDRVCQSNGKWSGRAPMCRALDCGRLSAPSNGKVFFSSTTVNSKAKYTCNSGFVLSGQSFRVCQSNGQWNGSAPTCKKSSSTSSCPHPSNPSNGKAKFTSTRIGSIVKYFCNSGYQLSGKTYRRCQSNGQWHGSAPTCVQTTPTPRSCSPLHNPANGDVWFRSTSPGSIAEYTCRRGFSLSGISQRKCLSSGKWEGSAPTCKSKSHSDSSLSDSSSSDSRQFSRQCPRPSAPSNGFAYVTCQEVGCRTSYWCRSGYWLHGSRKVVCQSNGKWSGSTPSCRR